MYVTKKQKKARADEHYARYAHVVVRREVAEAFERAVAAIGRGDVPKVTIYSEVLMNWVEKQEKRDE